MVAAGFLTHYLSGPLPYVRFRSDCSYSQAVPPYSLPPSPLPLPPFFLSCPGQRNRQRRALQQFALNVHFKHSDLTWPDLTWPSKDEKDICPYWFVLEFTSSICNFQIAANIKNTASVVQCSLKIFSVFFKWMRK